MSKLLYRAKNPEGKRQAGYVDAHSAEEALAKLKAAGHVDIELHSAVDSVALCTRLAGLNEAESAQMAEFELHAIEGPRGLWQALREVARRMRVWIAVDFVMLAMGLYMHNMRWVGLALGLLAFVFAIPTWRFLHAKRYDELLRAYAVGDWARVETLMARLEGASEAKNLEFDLATRRAVIQARRGALPEALAALAPWRDALEAKAPALYPARIAPVLAAAGDYPGFIQQMYEALARSNGEPIYRVDVALAEARFGDADKAREHLAAVDMEALPASGRAYVQWARGMIALKQGDASAQGFLAQAVAGFLARSTTPANWSVLAVCSGAYALALARDGKPDEARTILDRVAPVLAVHGDLPLCEGLRMALGDDALPPPLRRG